MNAWSHLPNACHIDRVFESIKSYPEIWDTAMNANRNAARDEARDAAWPPAMDAAMDADRIAPLDAAFDATSDMDWDAALDAAVALIAYDDASKYLDIPSDKLRVLAIISENPAAILLLPAVIAFERINELENAV